MRITLCIFLIALRVAAEDEHEDDSNLLQIARETDNASIVKDSVDTSVAQQKENMSSLEDTSARASLPVKSLKNQKKGIPGKKVQKEQTSAHLHQRVSEKQDSKRSLATKRKVTKTNKKQRKTSSLEHARTSEGNSPSNWSKGYFGMKGPKKQKPPIKISCGVDKETCKKVAEARGFKLGGKLNRHQFVDIHREGLGCFIYDISSKVNPSNGIVKHQGFAFYGLTDQRAEPQKDSDLGELRPIQGSPHGHGLKRLMGTYNCSTATEETFIGHYGRRVTINAGTVKAKALVSQHSSRNSKKTEKGTRKGRPSPLVSAARSQATPKAKPKAKSKATPKAKAKTTTKATLTAKPTATPKATPNARANADTTTPTPNTIATSKPHKKKITTEQTRNGKGAEDKAKDKGGRADDKENKLADKGKQSEHKERDTRTNSGDKHAPARKHEASAENRTREANAEKGKHEANAEQGKHEANAEKGKHEAHAEKGKHEANAETGRHEAHAEKGKTKSTCKRCTFTSNTQSKTKSKIKSNTKSKSKNNNKSNTNSKTNSNTQSNTKRKSKRRHNNANTQHNSNIKTS